MRLASLLMLGVFATLVTAAPRRGDDGEFYIWGPETFGQSAYDPFEPDIGTITPTEVRDSDEVFLGGCNVNSAVAARFHRRRINSKTGTSSGASRRSLMTRRLIMSRPFILRWRWLAFRRDNVPGFDGTTIGEVCDCTEIRTGRDPNPYEYDQCDENRDYNDATFSGGVVTVEPTDNSLDHPYHFQVFTQIGAGNQFTEEDFEDFQYDFPSATAILSLPWESSPDWSDMSARIPVESRTFANSIWFSEYGLVERGRNDRGSQLGARPMLLDDIEIVCPVSAAFPESTDATSASNRVLFDLSDAADFSAAMTFENAATSTDLATDTGLAAMTGPWDELIVFNGDTTQPATADPITHISLQRKAILAGVDLTAGAFLEFNVAGPAATAGHNLVVEWTTDGGLSWNNLFTFRGDHDGEFFLNGGDPGAATSEGVYSEPGGADRYIDHSNQPTRQVFFLPPDDDSGTIRWRQYTRSDVDLATNDQVWLLDEIYIYAPIPTTAFGAYALQFGLPPNTATIPVDWEEHVNVNTGDNTGEPSYVHLPSGGIPETAGGAEWSLDLVELGNSFTVEMWVKLPASLDASLNHRALISVTTGSDGDQEHPFSLVLSGPTGGRSVGSHLTFTVVDTDASTQTVTTPEALSVGEWHHVAGRVNGTEMSIFVDGEVAASTVRSDLAVKFIGSPFDAPFTISPDIYIGWEAAGFSNGFPAWGVTVDEARIWSLARTDAELGGQRFFVIEPTSEGFPPPLLMYLQFDDPEDCVGIESAHAPGSGYHAIQYGWTRSVLSDAPVSAPAISDGSEDDKLARVALTVNFASPSAVDTVDPVYTVTNFSIDALLFEDSGTDGVVGNPIPRESLPFETDKGNVFLRANNTDLCASGCQFFVSYYATVGTVNSTVGTAVAVVDTSFIAREYIFPGSEAEATTTEDPVDFTVRNALAAGIGTAGIISAGVIVVMQRRAYIARKNDRFRKLYANPRFMLRSAFTRPFKYTNENKELFEDNRKAFFYLEELLLEDNRVLLQAIFDIMPTEEADDASRATSYIFEGNGLAKELFSGFVQSETAEAVLLPKGDAENTLFRGYSIAAKMWTGYAKMGFGLNFLHKTLAQTLYEVCTSHAGKVEVDKERETKGDEDDILVSKYELLADAQKVFDAICNSVPFTPPHIRIFCNLVFEEVGINMGDHKYRAVGGFLFLRFFCPAIAVPESYGLLDENPADYARRLLVLVAKILQNLASNVEFGIKEEYMVTMNDFLSSNEKAFRQFVEDISELPEDLEEPPPAQLPTGVREVSLFILHKFMVENKTQLRSKITDIAADRAQADRIVKTMIKHIKRVGKGVVLERDDGLSSSDSSEEDRRKRRQKKKKRRSRSSKGSKGRRR